MRIEAWKCPRTGKLFDTSADWEAHLEALRREDERLAARPALLKNLANVQRYPFENATSLQHLGELLTQSYSKAVSLLVELDELPRAALEHELLEAYTVELILDELREPVRVAVEAPAGTLSFNGAANFIYKDAGPDSNPPDIYVVFPSLAAGTSSGGVGYNRFAERDEGKATISSYISIMVSHTPLLEALLPEYRRLIQGGLQPLLQEREEALIVIREEDPEYLAAVAGIGELNRQAQDIEQRKVVQRAVLERSKKRMGLAATSAIPRLVEAYGVLSRLGVEHPH